MKQLLIILLMLILFPLLATGIYIIIPLFCIWAHKISPIFGVFAICFGAIFTFVSFAYLGIIFMNLLDN